MTGVLCVVSASGSQTVTLEIINAWLTLTASPDSVVVGDPVTFTAASAVGGITVREWRWEPDSAGGAVTSAASCEVATSCTVRVCESGTMHVRARVGNGSSAVTERATAHVVATPPDYPIVQCPTGDSLLDLPGTRALLSELAQRTASITPKVEWAGYVYQMPNGQYRFLVDTLASNTCAGSYASPSAPTGWSHILLAHSHPSVPGDPICGGGGKFAAVGPHRGLLSPPDWHAADTRKPQPIVPVAVIDPRSIALARTGAWDSVTFVKNQNTGKTTGWLWTPSKAQFDSSYSQFKRKEGACLRP